MNVPFVDLKAQYRAIQSDVSEAIERVLSNTSFIGGPEVKAFEEAFARFQQVAHCISCANGTDALEIALLALGIGPGDEVIVPAMTWISTAEAVNTVGAEPVFVDVLADEYTLNPDLIEAALTEKTSAIIPVHFYGLPARMDRICAIAKKHGLFVIEDAAQAVAADIDGRRIGNFGQVTTFSFYPSKNLGAYGDAGAIVTNDASLEEKIRRIANHGQLSKHDHQILGRNSRLDAIHAAVMRVKLPHLEKWTELRRAHAQRYLQGIEKVKLPVIPEGYRHVFHLFVIQTDERDAVRDRLKSKGIATGIHYPEALPFVPAYGYKKHVTEDFPVAAMAPDRIISLPMYPELEDEQVNFVIQEINAL